MEDFRRRAELGELAYHRDGAGSTVTVIAMTNLAGQRNVSLKVNGKADASSGVDMSTQMLLGHLPMLLHPAAHSVLVVGAGSGVTVGTVLQHPGVRSVDLVEISPEVIEVAREHFAPFNHDALRDPRCRTASKMLKPSSRPRRSPSMSSSPSHRIPGWRVSRRCSVRSIIKTVWPA